MIQLLTPLLFIAVVIYIAWPLLRDWVEPGAAPVSTADLEQALEQRDELIDNLKDIDMDFRMGKLSPGDYQALKSDFEQRAVQVFRRLETLEKKHGRK